MAARYPGGVSQRGIVLGVAAAWWTLFAFVGAANLVAQHAIPWGASLAYELVASVPWIAITVAIFALSRRFPLRGARWLRSLAVHGAAGVGVVLLRAAYIWSLDPWMHWYDAPPPFELVLLHSVRNNLFQYFMVVGVAHAVIYAGDAIATARREAALTAALARAEQSALAATLHPHFLFNTLQAVAELVHRDADAADRMLVQLGALLRRLLDDHRPLVPLGDELAFVADYLAIEQARFGAGLAVRWDIADDVRALPVPRLSVQPLVENAIRHGLWPAGRPGTLVIAAHRRGDDLVVEVRDDGLGLEAAAAAGSGPVSGHGLPTIRARLERLYPGRGEVALAARAGAGAEARVVIPCEAPCAS